MFDNALFKLIRSVVQANLATYGIDTIVSDVLQTYQPTQQGANSRPTVYFYKLYDTLVGQPKRESKWGPLPPNLLLQNVLGDESGDQLTSESGALIGLDDSGIILANVPSISMANTEDPQLLTESGNPIGQEIPQSQYGMVNTQIQQYESPFQVMALVPQDATDVGGYTASDIVNLVAALLQGDAAMAAFRAQDVGYYRIAQVRNPMFQDDRDQNEASPSFDCVMTHKQTIVTTAPVMETTEFILYRV